MSPKIICPPHGLLGNGQTGRLGKQAAKPRGEWFKTQPSDLEPWKEKGTRLAVCTHVDTGHTDSGWLVFLCLSLNLSNRHIQSTGHREQETKHRALEM